MTYSVTCHCGAVEIEIDPVEDLGTARRCDCSFCRRRGAPMLGVPLDRLRIVKGQDNLSRYQWHSNTAKHYFCKTCGIYTHHQRRSNPNEYGVNLGAIDGINPKDMGPIGWADGINHPSDQS